MKPYQERVVAERDELSERIVKLRAFLSGPTSLELTEREHERLWLQLGLQLGLERVLNERIGAWDEAPVTGTHVAARDGQPERFIAHAV